MDIVRLEAQQLRLASEIIATAFFNYPMFTFYFPRPPHRRRYLKWYLRNVLNCAHTYGDIYTTPDLDGIIFTLPPEHTSMTLWQYVQNGFLMTPFILGLRNYVRSMTCEDFVGKTQARLMGDRPHTYLWGLAVDPNKQVKGVGRSLMQPVLDKADAETLPIYLETHDQRNVGYYERYGFTVLDNPVIPQYDVPIWCMVREPTSA